MFGRGRVTVFFFVIMSSCICDFYRKRTFTDLSNCIQNLIISLYRFIINMGMVFSSSYMFGNSILFYFQVICLECTFFHGVIFLFIM